MGVEDGIVPPGSPEPLRLDTNDRDKRDGKKVDPTELENRLGREGVVISIFIHLCLTSENNSAGMVDTDTVARSTGLYDLADPSKKISPADVEAILRRYDFRPVQQWEVSQEYNLATTGITSAQNDVNRDISVADRKRDIAIYKKTVANLKKDHRPHSIGGYPVFSMRAKPLDKWMQKTGLDGSEVRRLALAHMSERNGGVDFGLGERSPLVDEFDNNKYLDVAVVEPDEGDDSDD